MVLKWIHVFGLVIIHGSDCYQSRTISLCVRGCVSACDVLEVRTFATEFMTNILCHRCQGQNRAQQSCESAAHASPSQKRESNYTQELTYFLSPLTPNMSVFLWLVVTVSLIITINRAAPDGIAYSFLLISSCCRVLRDYFSSSFTKWLDYWRKVLQANSDLWWFFLFNGTIGTVNWLYKSTVLLSVVENVTGQGCCQHCRGLSEIRT